MYILAAISFPFNFGPIIDYYGFDFSKAEIGYICKLSKMFKLKKICNIEIDDQFKGTFR